MAELQERRRSLQALLSARLAELRCICLQEAVSDDIIRPVPPAGIIQSELISFLDSLLSLLRSRSCLKNVFMNIFIELLLYSVMKSCGFIGLLDFIRS